MPQPAAPGAKTETNIASSDVDLLKPALFCRFRRLLSRTHFHVIINRTRYERIGRPSIYRWRRLARSSASTERARCLFPPPLARWCFLLCCNVLCFFIVCYINKRCNEHECEMRRQTRIAQSRFSRCPTIDGQLRKCSYATSHSAIAFVVFEWYFCTDSRRRWQLQTPGWSFCRRCRRIDILFEFLACDFSKHMQFGRRVPTSRASRCSSPRSHDRRCSRSRRYVGSVGSNPRYGAVLLRATSEMSCICFLTHFGFRVVFCNNETQGAGFTLYDYSENRSGTNDGPTNYPTNEIC